MATSTAVKTGTPTWQLDPTHSSVEFSVKHMMMTTVRGRFREFGATLRGEREHPEHAAGLDRLAPLEAPLAAVDLRAEAEPRARLPPRIGPAPLVLAVEHELHRAVADDELPDDAEAVALGLRRRAIESRAPEGDLRVALGIEEVATAEVTA